MNLQCIPSFGFTVSNLLSSSVDGDVVSTSVREAITQIFSYIPQHNAPQTITTWRRLSNAPTSERYKSREKRAWTPITCSQIYWVVGREDSDGLLPCTISDMHRARRRYARPVTERFANRRSLIAKLGCCLLQNDLRTNVESSVKPYEISTRTSLPHELTL